MNNSFTAIDFETAHHKHWSICQVGLACVEKEIITEQLSILVQPPHNRYNGYFIDIHGISPEDTAQSPTFDEVWHLVEPFIKDRHVVAHNSAFDFSCLKQTLAYYDLPMPEFTGHCTYKIFKARLNVLCQQYSIPLNHHDALSDARACAELFKIHLKNKQNLSSITSTTNKV